MATRFGFSTVVYSYIFLHVEVLYAQLRPVFQTLHLGLDQVDAHETAVFKVVFACLNFARRELHDVDNSQVHSSYLGRIIVDQTDHALLAIAFDQYFLVKFALHAGAVPVVTDGILDRDVSSDSDGSKCVQAFFALAFASGVLEEPGLICIAAFENHIRNQLLKRRICFNETSRAKGLIVAIENRWQITIYVWLKSRKGPQLIEQFRWNYKNFFVCRHVQLQFLWVFVDFEEQPRGNRVPLTC